MIIKFSIIDVRRYWQDIIKYVLFEARFSINVAVISII